MFFGLHDPRCNSLSRLLMWYLWVLLGLLYMVAVYAISFNKYCSHKRSMTRKPDLNSIYHTHIIIDCICGATCNQLYVVSVAIDLTTLPFPLVVFFVAVNPLALMMYFIILIVRQVCSVRLLGKKSRDMSQKLKRPKPRTKLSMKWNQYQSQHSMYYQKMIGAHL